MWLVRLSTASNRSIHEQKKSLPVAGQKQDQIGVETSIPISDLGSTFNVFGTDEEQSDEDCGYKWYESDEENESQPTLLADLEKIDHEKLPVKFEL